MGKFDWLGRFGRYGANPNGGSYTEIKNDGAININVDTDATSTDDGSLHTSGGASVKKSLYVGDVSGTPINFASLDANNKFVVSNISIATLDNKKEYCGFENRIDSEYSFNTSTNVFTIQPVTTSYNIWTGNAKYTKTSSESVNITITNDITFIYFNHDGTLIASGTPWGFEDNVAFVAIIFLDSSGEYALTDERHGYDRDRAWHGWAHNTIGARYKSGFTGTFTNTTLSVTQGIIYDEDIKFDSLATQTTCSLWYRDSNMRLVRNSSTPYLLDAGDLKWDNNGVLTTVPNNDFINSYIYASNDPDEPIYCVIGQNTHANISAARAEAFPEIRLSTAEWKLLYRVTYRYQGGSPIYQEAVDFRRDVGPIGQQATSSSHTALIDREADNSHPATAISFTDGLFTAIDVQDAIIEAQEKVKDIITIDLSVDLDYTILPSDAGKTLRIQAALEDERDLNVGNDIPIGKPITIMQEYDGTLTLNATGDMVLTGTTVEEYEELSVTYYKDVRQELYGTFQIIKLENNLIRII